MNKQKPTLTVFILLTLIAVLSGCGGSESSATNKGQATEQQEQQEIYKWKMVTTWPKNFPGLGMAAENFATLVEKMSGGRLQVKVYGAGQLVPALETFDTVSRYGGNGS